MKDKDKYNQFILKLKAYDYDKKELQELKDEFEWKWYKHCGVTGVDPSKSPLQGFNASYIEEMQHDQRDELYDLLDKIDLLEKNIKYIDHILYILDDEPKMMFTEVYIDKKSFENVALLHNSSVGHIQYLMKKSFLELD